MRKTDKLFLLLILLISSLLLPIASPIVAFAETSAEFETPDSPELTDSDKKALLSALYEADIATVREAILLRLITCRELTAYYLERIEKYNPVYNCFITMCDNALEEASKRDALLASGKAEGTLFGVPIVVKDNIDYIGYHTTNGFKKSSDQIAKANSAIVENLIKEGAVILAKANMSKEAQEARISKSASVGETKNAYDPLLASGGSSGGSAVATSLNFALASLGTDTNSSLRYPAALNGCVSLRPTAELLSREGIVLLNKARDTAGSITRTVKDQAIMLDALIGGGKYAESLNSGILSGMRIGVLKELSGPVSGRSDRTAAKVDAEILAAFNSAVEELKACGAEVVTVSMPKIFTMSSACAETKSGYTDAKKSFYSAFEKLLTDYAVSAVIFPTYLHAPQWTGVNESGGLKVYDQTYITNAPILSPPLGIPEISVPIGTHSRGAGIGMEIATLRGGDQLLLDIAYSYSEKCDHRAVPAGAPDIYAEYNAGTLEEFIRNYKDSLTKTDTETETVPITSDVTTPEETTEESTPIIEETTVKEPYTNDVTTSGQTDDESKDPVVKLQTWYILGVVAVMAIFLCAVLIPHRKNDIFEDVDAEFTKGSEEITDFIGFGQEFEESPKEDNTAADAKNEEKTDKDAD